MLLKNTILQQSYNLLERICLSIYSSFQNKQKIMDKWHFKWKLVSPRENPFPSVNMKWRICINSDFHLHGQILIDEWWVNKCDALLNDWFGLSTCSSTNYFPNLERDFDYCCNKFKTSSQVDWLGKRYPERGECARRNFKYGLSYLFYGIY